LKRRREGLLMLARTIATAKHGCRGCHDRSWNGHPNAPRDTIPLRCPACPVHRLMRAGGVPINPRKVSAYGGGGIAASR
jgi:hypothetical protein